MFSTAEKTTSTTVNRSKSTVDQAFFRKAGEDTFFGSHDQTSFFHSSVQPKLEISSPEDPQEKEADAVAEKVMRMSEPLNGSTDEQKEEESLQRQESEEEKETVQAKQEEEEQEEQVQAKPMLQRQEETEEEETVQPKLSATVSRKEERESELMTPPSNIQTGGGFTVYTKRVGQIRKPILRQANRGPPAMKTNFQSSLSSTKGKGSPLPDSTRTFMESRFQADFRDVRVHTGEEAGSLSRSIQAQAFTHGNDIYFNSGRYSPHTPSGSLLLAHELTHTIQQGASPINRKGYGALQRKKSFSKPIQRSAESQRQAAVNLAKGEQGKVAANKSQSDGSRHGWQRLMEYFKTSLGPDKILPEGAAFKPNTVNESQIKTKSTFVGDVIDPGDGKTVLHNQPRDAMPSWCGIFAFWALNKGGIPLKKWTLGSNMIPPDAAYPSGYVPKPGDLAYRREFSHYALVESSDGSKVTSVNGNTSGDDNVGGEIEVQTHPLDHWYGFFDPTKMMDGVLQDPGNPNNPDAAPVRSLRELRKKLFNVQRKEESVEESLHIGEKNQEQPVQSKAQDGNKPAKAEPIAQPKISSPIVGGETIQKETQEEEKENEQQSEPCSQCPIHRSLLSSQARQAENSPNAEPIDRKHELDRKQEFESETDQEEQKEELQRKSDESESRAPPRAPPSENIVAKNQPAIVQRWLGDAWDAVTDVVSDAVEYVEEGLDAAKEWLLEKVRDFVSEIPGYKVLSLILGEDPITGQATPLTGENLLEAGLDLLPAGSMFRSLLNRLGIYNDVSTWLQGRIVDLSAVATGISDRFIRFWDNLSLSDVGDPDGVMNDVASLLRNTIQDIVSFIETSAETFLERIKEVMVGEIAAFVKARIPRLYPLLTVALGFDPETMETVERNGTNILNAFLEISEDGREQRRQMIETGTFERIVGWIDRGIAVFSRAYQLLRAAIANIWDYVTVENLFQPIETFTQIWNEFSEPVRIVGQFLIDAAIEILKVIKDALLSRLSAHAKETKGYSLITVIIGRDPFTGKRVRRTVHNLVKGFMSLMDGGEQQYQQLKETGAIDRVVNKVNAAVERLNMTPESIIQLFIDLWNSFSINDLTDPIGAFQRIVATFGEPILRLIRFVIDIIMIVIEAILILMNFPFDLIGNIITRAMQAFQSIKRDPVGFLLNLLRAIKQGFIQFFDNIVKHLINGVVGWLMSELRDANVPEPQDFSLKGIIGWVLEVLGISMEAIWQKLAAHPRIGPEKVARLRSIINTLEGIWTFIKDVQERGIAAIWERIQEQLSNLWQTVLDAVKNWIIEKIITQVTVKLLSMLDPTGIMAVVNSAIAIYKAVQSFIRYLRQMLEIINSFVNGVADIAQGNIKTAADYLEKTMGQAMPIVIGFLANQVGLGGIGKRIAEMIGAARNMVDRALTWLVNKAVNTGMALLDRVVSMGRSAAGAVKAWARGLLGLNRPFTTPDGQRHRIYYAERGNTVKLMLNPSPAGAYEQQINQINPAASATVTLANAIAIPLKRNGNTVSTVNIPAGNTTMTALKSHAIRVAQHIDGLITSNMRTRTDQSTGVKDQTPDFNASLEGLSQVTSYLLSAETGGPMPVTPVPAYGGLENGFASRMDVKPLTKLGVPGTGVSITSPDYEDLLRRRETPGGRSYYIAGHLLNNNVHGSGSTWSNLTPITQRANQEHESKVESKVKQAVDADQILQYTVDVDYAISRNATRIGEIEAVPNWQLNSVLDEKHKILEAEAKLPTQLRCTVKQIKADGTDLPTSDPKYNAGYNISGAAGTINNQATVNQSSLDIYYLRSATAVTYKTMAQLTAAANTAVGANLGAAWDTFYNNAANKISIDNLPNSDQETLRNIFRKANTIREERSRISSQNDMQTWNSFIGNRVAYTGNLLSTGDKTDLFNRFNQRMLTLKGHFMSTMRNYVTTTLTDKNMQWGTFRTTQGMIARTYSYLGNNFTLLSDSEVQTFRTEVFEPRIAELNASEE